MILILISFEQFWFWYWFHLINFDFGIDFIWWILILMGIQLWIWYWYWFHLINFDFDGGSNFDFRIDFIWPILILMGDPTLICESLYNIILNKPYHRRSLYFDHLKRMQLVISVDLNLIWIISIDWLIDCKVSLT